MPPLCPSSIRHCHALSFYKFPQVSICSHARSAHKFSNLLPKFQSGYRSHHSTETLLVRLLSDIHTAIENGELRSLHYWTCRPLSILSTTISSSKDSEPPSVSGVECWNGWSRSFVVDLNPSILATSNPSGVSSAPEYRRDQSSDHCYIYFSHRMFFKSLVELVQESNNTPTIRRHVYIHCKANEATEAVRRLQSTLSEIRDWMSSNRLKLNPSKTQWIWIGTRMQLAKIDMRELLERFPGIVFESSVVDLGVVIDRELKMDAHLGIMTRSCFYQLRQLRTIRQSLISDNDLDILALTETWVGADDPPVIKSDPAPSGYRITHVHRDNPEQTRGGGLAVIHRDTITVQPRKHKLTHSSFELQIVNIGLKSRDIVLANIYRPPSSSKPLFFEEFGLLLTNLGTDAVDRLLICGDFNLPGTSPDKIDSGLAELLESTSFTQFVNSPTRHDSHHLTSSLLDLIITPSPSNLVSATSVVSSHEISDHDLTLANLNTKRLKSPQRTYQYRNIKDIDLQSFQHNILSSSLVSDPDPTVDGYADQMESVITSAP